jgi:hypothetical protein
MVANTRPIIGPLIFFIDSFIILRRDCHNFMEINNHYFHLDNLIALAAGFDIILL